MPAREVALEMRAWAVKNGMYTREHQVPEERVERFEGRLPNMDWSAASEIFQRRRISFIGFNELNDEVVVYTSTNITKSQKNIVPTEVDDTKITYKKASVASVTGQVPHPQTVPHTRFNGRYTCGSSIYVGNSVGAGTLGALVRDEDERLYGLSNNHVTALCNYADLALPIVAPGPADVRPGNIDPFTIGHHYDVVTFSDGSPDNVPADENADGAIFLLKDSDLVSSMQRDCYDTPTEVADVEHNMVVQKVGRTSGITQGVVRVESAGPEPVEYSMRDFGIYKSVYFDPVFIIEGTNIPFASEGDSGSLITSIKDGGKRYAVGIVIAVSKDGSQTFALPIRTVLEYFKVSLVSGHNI